VRLYNGPIIVISIRRERERQQTGIEENTCSCSHDVATGLHGVNGKDNKPEWWKTQYLARLCNVPIYRHGVNELDSKPGIDERTYLCTFRAVLAQENTVFPIRLGYSELSLPSWL